MRKVMLVFFSLLAIMMMTMPAYAQGGTTAAAGGDQLDCHYLGLCHCDRRRIGRSWPGPSRRAQPAKAMARNPAARPAIQLALILGLAFIESLVLFTLVIIFAKVV